MEFIGRNAIQNLSDLIDGKVLLFTQDGIYNLFKEKLPRKQVVLYTRMSENPKREEIQLAQNLFNGEFFDIIVAFGGGSVIDFAKAFRFYDNREVHLIAIPTTAGTGSQATQFAVVYVNGVKTSLDNPIIKPNHVIVDSQFVENAPRYLKACCAMDAYCQAIESFWAKKSTQESQKYALEAIQLCHDFLNKAVNTSDPEANEKMALAAHLAGKAINISRTTAAHALSYKITSKYGIPHGHAVALSIANLFLQNMDYCDIKPILKILQISEENIKRYFHILMQTIGLEDNLEKLGIFDLEEIVDNINLDRLSNNPKKLDRDDLLKLLSK
ncbi:MAG: phosphonoacetaldehyde reductase [Alphaproteobacteria bacterium]|nr:phosphonoacetaldehyde reductase [Alphaproteobacteria bacterium]